MPTLSVAVVKLRLSRIPATPEGSAAKERSIGAVTFALGFALTAPSDLAASATHLAMRRRVECEGDRGVEACVNQVLRCRSKKVLELASVALHVVLVDHHDLCLVRARRADLPRERLARAGSAAGDKWTYRELKGAGHALPLEQPVAWRREVLDFLDGDAA